MEGSRLGTWRDQRSHGRQHFQNERHPALKLCPRKDRDPIRKKKKDAPTQNALFGTKRVPPKSKSTTSKVRLAARAWRCHSNCAHSSGFTVKLFLAHVGPAGLLQLNSSRILPAHREVPKSTPNI